MSDFDDDFGGFEVAETLDDTDEPSLLLGDDPVTISNPQAASSTDVSAIPWLAASIQASTSQPVSASSPADLTAASVSIPPATQTQSALSNSQSTSQSTSQAVDYRSAFASLSSEDPTEATNLSSLEPSIQGGHIKTTSADNSQSNTDSHSESHSEATKASLKDLQSQLQASHDLNTTCRSEMNKLRLDYDEISHKLDKVNTELDLQRKRYTELQDKHKDELEEIRSANQKAMTVIIEEYKESMRLAILEQQKSSLDMLSEHMKSEGGKYRQLITEQSDRLDEWKAACKVDLGVNKEQNLETLQTQLQEERESMKSDYQSQIDITKEKLLLLKTETITDMETQITNHMSQLDIRSKELVNDVKEELKIYIDTQVKKSSDAQRTISLDYWETHSKELMDTLRTRLDDTIQTHTASLDSYIADKVNTDRTLQKKHLSAISVYLEAANQHLSSLTTSEPSGDKTVTTLGPSGDSGTS